MAKSIMLSIHPKWAEKIYSGEKTIEWRKTYPKKLWYGGQKVFIYETRPIGKITGYFVLKNIDYYDKNGKDAKFLIKENVERMGCVSITELNKYQGNGECVYAWEIVEAVKYENPQTLADFGLKRAPQSWQYVEV